MTLFSRKTLPAAISLALGTALVPFAVQAGWYVGAGAGATSFEETGITAADVEDIIVPAIIDSADVSLSEDDSDTGFKVLAGYRFNQYVAVEVQFADLGTASLDFTGEGDIDGGEGGSIDVDIAGGADVDVDGFGINVEGSWPINESLSLIGKIGMFSWDAESAGSIDLTVGGDTESFAVATDDDGTDVNFGIGARYTFMKQLGVQLEWERYALESDVDLISASVTWEFGAAK